MQKFIINLLKEAGKILKDGFYKELFRVDQRTTSKQAASFYDKLIDQFLIDKILQKFPSHNLLTEESGYIHNDVNSPYLWIIDSLDGTGNFANSNPLFSICLAVFYNFQPLMGFVYIPLTDELFWAKKGKGAFLNNKPIKVSSIKEINQSYGIYCEGHLQNKKKLVQIINKIYPQVIELRKIGSAGIEICYVASGRADFYFTTQIDIWDIAAGTIILQEAGGKVTNFKGKKFKLQRGNYIFSNKILHSKLVKIFRKFKI